MCHASVSSNSAASIRVRPPLRLLLLILWHSLIINAFLEKPLCQRLHHHRHDGSVQRPQGSIAYAFLHQKTISKTPSYYCCSKTSLLQQKYPSVPLETNVISNNNNNIGIDYKSNNDDNLQYTEEEIQQSMDYLAQLIRLRLQSVSNRSRNNDNNPHIQIENNSNNSHDCRTERKKFDDMAYQLAKGRFRDLTTTLEGEEVLENLFLASTATATTTATTIQEGYQSTEAHPQTSSSNDVNIDVRHVQFAIVSLQSLLIYAMQIGVKGSEEAQKKMVHHLFRPGEDPPIQQSLHQTSKTITWAPTWNSDAIRRLKFLRNGEWGKQLLARLVRKRTSHGAYDLLVEMGVWGRMEEVALLRSGFPVMFLEEEIRVSREAEQNTRDPDTVLGIRKDLRQQKVYTIDDADTQDIDDGLSVEALDNDPMMDSEQRYRFWIHIADVDRWAPRGSKLLSVAERRSTSLYLPSMTLSMFPSNMSSGVMSLESNKDKYALSLGVILNSDGSIDPSSIIVTPSLIHVDYRLTYDQVDEMLDEGVGHTEEWQVGVMLSAAIKRRAYRVKRSSVEGIITHPIPKGIVSAKYNDLIGSFDVSLRIESTHNSGFNITAAKKEDQHGVHYDQHTSAISSSQLIVTEMMILAGEAIGKWHSLQPMIEDASSSSPIQLPNVMTLPFRRQPAPDFKSREEAKQADFLFAINALYPHAWYCRRFFRPASVSEEPGPHFGMGLDCYVQWSSPIRRITDLQVHAAIKRYLRRKRVNELLSDNVPIPQEITDLDLGCYLSHARQVSIGRNKTMAAFYEEGITIDSIDYRSGLGMIYAARPIQSASSKYWMYEYIQQKKDAQQNNLVFESIVLGCVDTEKLKYAVYVYELGLEHKYSSEIGKLEEGQKIWLKVASVNPRLELLTFSVASKSGGVHTHSFYSPAA